MLCSPRTSYDFVWTNRKHVPVLSGRLVESPIYKRFVQSQVGGAAQPNINAQVLGAFRFSLPSFREQEQIADVLSAYDELIENNRRRMGLFEEAARLLYREWFVRLRFPAHEHTRIVDGVAQGWDRMPAAEAIEINPHTKLSDEEEHWWIEMADLPTQSMVIQNAIKREGRSGSKFRNGDTLFGAHHALLRKR